MKSKILMQVAVLLAAVLLFAGCGGADVSTTPTGAPDTTVGATPTGATEPAAITIDELRAKLDAGVNIVLVDSRSTRSYDRGHIAEAVSVPLEDLQDDDGNALPAEELNQRYDYLRGFEEIIIY